MYKAGGVSITERLTMLFTSRWESGEVPQDLRDAVIVSLYKKKENAKQQNKAELLTVVAIVKLTRRFSGQTSEHSQTAELAFCLN